MNIFKATTSFEGWLRARIPVVEADLHQKHELMVEDEFRFFRGTFYRWARLWPKHCKELASAPSVLAVGDLHVNSFGTWRDKFGRLVGGIDDFDEAYFLPYTNDLVRLATSARLAYSLDHLQTNTKNACEAGEQSCAATSPALNAQENVEGVVPCTQSSLSRTEADRRDRQLGTSAHGSCRQLGGWENSVGS
jgi:hypothetical protein